MDFDELEVTPEIEEKLWVKHRVLVDEVEEAPLNPHIENGNPETRNAAISTEERLQDVICSLL